jgi:magnesium-transporting ATPase (P-type)
MATLHGGGSPVVYLKGSVESLLERCDTILGADGESKPLDSDTVHARVEALASQGQRVLAFAPREPGIMLRPPRTPDTTILSGELIFRIVLVGLLLLMGSFGLFEWALYHGASEAEARTIAVNVFAVGQSFYLLNCRLLRYSMFRLGLFSNPWIWGGIAALTVAQLLSTYAPLMNRMLHTAPIGLMDWAHILAVGLVIHLVIGAEKRFRRRREMEDSKT